MSTHQKKKEKDKVFSPEAEELQVLVATFIRFKKIDLLEALEAISIFFFMNDDDLRATSRWSTKKMSQVPKIRVTTEKPDEVFPGLSIEDKTERIEQVVEMLMDLFNVNGVSVMDGIMAMFNLTGMAMREAGNEEDCEKLKNLFIEIIDLYTKGERCENPNDAK